MAKPPCMSGDGNEAVFVGTMLDTGDAVALCDACLVGWSAALLQVMTGVDPTPFIAAISEDDGLVELTAEQVAEAEALEAETRTRPPSTPGRAGRTSRASREAGTGDAPPGVETEPEPDVSPPAA